MTIDFTIEIDFATELDTEDFLIEFSIDFLTEFSIDFGINFLMEFS